jgi:hypothetical protein
MNKFVTAWKALASFLASEPALTLALVNFGVVLAGHFGFHVTGDQLLYYIGIINVLVGVLTRALVTPNAHLTTVAPPVTINLPATNASSAVAHEVGAEVAKSMAQTRPSPKRRSRAHPATSKPATEVAASVMGEEPQKEEPANDGTTPAV